MKIAVISSSIGGFDKKQDHVKQSVDCDFFHFDDENYPPRNALSPRLQARSVKMFGWQLAPEYDLYLWIDSSCRLSREDSVEWFVKQLGAADFVTFKHPHRKTVQEEADYLKHRLEINCPYVTPRYAGERLDEQMAMVDPNGKLYATTALMYRNDTPAKDLMAIWWIHNSLYHTNDQLSLDTAILHSGADVNVIDENYLKCEHIEHVRKQK